MIQWISKKNTSPCPVRNEKGFALITVLVLSAVLMATMAIVMNSSTMELIMSGASSVSKMALARADAGVEYVRGSFSLIGYNDPLNPFNSSTEDPDNPGYLPIRNEYLNDQSALAGVPATVMDTTNTGFTLSVMKQSDNSMLPRGFSGGLSSSMRLSAYPCRISSTGTVGLYAKTVQMVGVSLAP